MRSCQFTDCHRTMHFHDTHTSLPITRSEEYKRTRLKVELGVRPALEARQIAEEDHTWLEAEEETCIVEEARPKSEEEEQAC